MNYLNVCSPSAEDRQQIAGTLESISAHPHFAADFEVARGRSTMSNSDLLAASRAEAGAPPAADTADESVSDWIRIRHEFPGSSPFVNAQYSFSINPGQVVETLTFRARNAKDVIQISISDTVHGPDSPAQAARLNTPAERIRIERFGKASIVLARCPSADQAQFEPLFTRASTLLASYRASLRVPAVVPAEIARLPKTDVAHPRSATAKQAEKK